MAKSKAQRAKENADVKNGEIRKGRAGNKYNRWDKKTATWVPVSAARTGAGSGQKGQGAITGSRKATSATVSNAQKAKKPGVYSKVAPGASATARGGKSAVPSSGRKYSSQTKQSMVGASKSQVAATLLAAGTIPLAGMAGLSGVLGAGAARGALAAGASRAAVGAARAPKAIGGGSVKAIGGGAKAVGRATPVKAITRGTPAQRAAATRAANKAKIATAKKVAKGTKAVTRKRAVTIAKRAG